MKTNANNRKKKKNKGNSCNPSQSVTIYTGPAIVPRSLTGGDLVTEEFTNSFGYTSSASGTLTEVWNSDPTSAVDWSAAAALYTLYRVLAFTLTFTPNIIGAVLPSTMYTPLYTVIDNGNDDNLAGYAAASVYASVRRHVLNKPWSRTVRMDTVDLAEFVLIGGSPDSFMQFKTFCTGLTNSTTYGTIDERYLVQFKGRQ